MTQVVQVLSYRAVWLQFTFCMMNNPVFNIQFSSVCEPPKAQTCLVSSKNGFNSRTCESVTGRSHEAFLL